MATLRASRRAQRGVALLGLLAIAVMVFAYVLTSRLNAASRFVGIDRDDNAKVLSEAKRALISWMAVNAATDNNPGRLPCPQAWGDFGTANEGRAAGNCSVPAAGWLPWRTLGMDRPLDASGNQIWYVVSPGWHLPSAAATLSINSDSTGQLSLSGQPAVALLIAPGPALAIAPNANQIAAGCAARIQSQVLALPGTPPDPLDFLECQNGSTADNVFAASVVDNAVNPAFNDQVLAITAADVMPALEAAIAERMQREIAPAMRNVYTSAKYSGIPASTPLYPYPVAWANPGPGAGTSNYRGVAGMANPQGLLPFNQTQGCTASASNPRCLPHPALIAYASAPSTGAITNSAGNIDNLSCFWETVNDVRVCDGRYQEAAVPSTPIRVELAATFNNYAMGLRDIDNTGTHLQVFAKDDIGGSWSTAIAVTPVTYTATMNSGGSVTLSFGAVLPNIDDMGWGSRGDFRLRIERAAIGDHALLDATSIGPGSTGWFVRNDWYRLTYYAVAATNTADALASLGCGKTNCLRINEGLGCTPPAAGNNWCNIRALLVLGGASISNPAGRPNGNILDYFEYTNNDGGTFYEQHQIRRPTNVAIANGPWNDRVILVDWVPSLPPLTTGTHPQVVSVSPLRIHYLPYLP